MTSLEELIDRVRPFLALPGVVTHLDEPVQLSSGQMSRDFVDGKLAVASPEGMEAVGEAMVALAQEAGAHFEAVGGIVLGAVPFTFAVARAARVPWFLVRKEAKGRGTNRLLEGARIADGMPVMVVDDVITTGGSIRESCERAAAEGAKVVFATTLLDRGEHATAMFEDLGVTYRPLLTYRDVGIDPI